MHTTHFGIWITQIYNNKHASSLAQKDRKLNLLIVIQWLKTKNK